MLYNVHWQVHQVEHVSSGLTTLEVRKKVRDLVNELDVWSVRITDQNGREWGTIEFPYTGGRG
jgi:hypothetical protein